MKLLLYICMKILLLFISKTFMNALLSFIILLFLSARNSNSVIHNLNFSYLKTIIVLNYYSLWNFYLKILQRIKIFVVNFRKSCVCACVSACVHVCVRSCYNMRCIIILLIVVYIII